MNAPLALLLYEKIMPGSQLVNRLQDLGYRVQTLSDAALLVEVTEREKPMIVLADLSSRRNKVAAAIGGLKQNSATAHVPVIAFCPDQEGALPSLGHNARAALVVTNAAVVHHLPQLLEQALTDF